MSDIKIIMLIGLGIYYFIKYANRPDKKSRNQKPQAQPVSSENQDPERSLEDIIKELSGDLEPQPKPTPVQKGFLKDHTTKSISNRTKRRTAHVEHTNKIEVEELDDEQAFDLRQAIIYDAVLNRPHQ